jgi:thymidylate synthase
MIELWRNGILVKTQYDNPNDPPSKDCTMMIEVENPLQEPRIHLSFPGGFVDLKKYEMEVVEGVHDYLIDPDAKILKKASEAGSGRWDYTYPYRLNDFPIITKEGIKHINQIAIMVDKLSETPYTRRAQAITWIPSFDNLLTDPPCLQRVWGRILRDEMGVLRFNMNISWRSRDAYKAAFMNMYAFASLQKTIAQRIAEKIGEEVLLGRLCDFSDSYHIYGKNLKDAEGRLMNRIKRTEFFNEEIPKSRTIKSDSPLVVQSFNQAVEQIKQELEKLAQTNSSTN